METKFNEQLKPKKKRLLRPGWQDKLPIKPILAATAAVLLITVLVLINRPTATVLSSPELDVIKSTGVLRVGGANAGYYSTTAGSIGFQAGAQSKAMFVLFMTDEALNKFRNSNGWTVGADATVAVVNIGANGRIDTNTAQQPVVGFVLNNGGLMAGVSLEGTKIAKIDM